MGREGPAGEGRWGVRAVAEPSPVTPLEVALTVARGWSVGHGNVNSLRVPVADARLRWSC